VSLVTTDSLAAVEVAVNSRVELVQQVRLVRAGSLGSRAGGAGVGSGRASETRSTSGASGLAVGSTVISVRVDAGVGSVGSTGRVRSVGALGSTSGAAVGGRAQSVTGSGAAVGGRAQSVAVSGAAGGRAQSIAMGGAVGGAAGGTTESVGGGIALRVQAHVLAVVAVRVDARVGLVQQVAVVRTTSLGGGTADTTVGTSCAKGTLLSSNSMVGWLMDASSVAGGLKSRGLDTRRLKAR
jgi:hypothetical protein